eukprot:9517202-Lingulodinium_polyedra.AAC.1
MSAQGHFWEEGMKVDTAIVDLIMRYKDHSLYGYPAWVNQRLRAHGRPLPSPPQSAPPLWLA